VLVSPFFAFSLSDSLSPWNDLPYWIMYVVELLSSSSSRRPSFHRVRNPPGPPTPLRFSLNSLAQKFPPSLSPNIFLFSVWCSQSVYSTSRLFPTYRHDSLSATGGFFPFPSDPSLCTVSSKPSQYSAPRAVLMLRASNLSFFMKLVFFFSGECWWVFVGSLELIFWKMRYEVVLFSGALGYCVVFSGR